MFTALIVFCSFYKQSVTLYFTGGQFHSCPILKHSDQGQINLIKISYFQTLQQDKANSIIFKNFPELFVTFHLCVICFIGKLTLLFIFKNKINKKLCANQNMFIDGVIIPVINDHIS